MDGNAIDALVRDQRLEAMMAAFPDEVAAAIATALAERDALAALPLDPFDAP